MRRLGNTRTILEIEAIVGQARKSPEQFRWEACGVDCHHARHRYSGPEYAFTIDVLSLHAHRARRPWRLVVTSELWRSGAIDLRSFRWLKLMSGKPADVLDWVASCRDTAPRSPVSSKNQGRL